MGTVLLIRHGQSIANAQGILAGRNPQNPLDEVGENTARLLGEQLAKIAVAHVVVSPLERTKQTAELVFGTSTPIEVDERLIECDYGDWQGRLLSELTTEAQWEVVQKTPDLMLFPNGESMIDMAQRAVSGIREWDARLSEQHGDQVVWAAISHGDVIKAICADALDLPLRSFQRISIEPISVSVVQYSKEGSRVHKLNDTGLQWLSALAKMQRTENTIGGEVNTE